MHSLPEKLDRFYNKKHQAVRLGAFFMRKGGKTMSKPALPTYGAQPRGSPPLGVTTDLYISQAHALLPFSFLA